MLFRSKKDDRNELIERMRNNRAKSWRCVRERIKTLPIHQREAMIRFYNDLGCPHDPEYLLSMIHDYHAKKANYIAKLIEIHQLKTRGRKASCFA